MTDVHLLQEQIAAVNSLPDKDLDELYRTAEEVKSDMELNPFYYWEPQEKQRKFIDCECLRKWLFGGNQSGKTVTGAWYVVSKSLGKENHEAWCGAETWEISRLIQQKKISEILPWDDVEDWVSYTEKDGFKHSQVKFKNGSSIIFKTYEQTRKKWQGGTLDLIWLDEEPPSDIYAECHPRLVKKHGELIGTMTSLEGYTRLVEEVLLTKKKGVKVYFMSTYENKYLSKKAVKDLEEQIEEKDRKARLRGIPTPKTGRVFEGFVHQEPLVIPHNKESIVNQSWPTIVSIDPHPRTPHAATLTSVAPDGDLWVWKERPWLLREGSLDKAEWVTPEQLVHEIERNCNSRNIEIKIIDKHACNQSNIITGTSIRDELINLGFYTAEIGGDVDAKVVLMQQYIRKNKIHIFESCWNLLWEIERYIWDPHITQKVADRKEEKQKPRKKNDHLIDCILNTILWIRQNWGTNFRPPPVQRNPQEFDIVQGESTLYTHGSEIAEFGYEKSFMESYQ